MNYIDFYKLTVTKCIMGNPSLFGATIFNGLSSPNTAVNIASGDEGKLSVFNGFNGPSTKYFMYCVNDTASTRRTNVVRVTIAVNFSDLSNQSISIIIPANVPVRVQVPSSLITIPSGQSISSIAFASTLPTAPTLIDGYIEFNYTQ